MYQSIIHGIKHISTKLTVVFNLDCSGQSSRVAPRGRGGGGGGGGGGYSTKF